MSSFNLSTKLGLIKGMYSPVNIWQWELIYNNVWPNCFVLKE